jgi:hypothetical protein
MNPCYKCTDRQVGCHSKCEKYKKWKKESNKKRDAKFIDREYESYISDTIKRR